MGQRPNMQELAQLLVKVHSLPTEWFHDYCQSLREEYPSINLRMHPHTRMAFINLMNVVAHPDVIWASMTTFWRFDLLVCTPSTPAASRLVTCHGDFHFGNILRTPS